MISKKDWKLSHNPFVGPTGYDDAKNARNNFIKNQQNERGK